MTTLANARLGDELVDIEIADGLITAISAASEGPVLSAGDSIDLEGRWVLPGLWDHHAHFNQQALAVRRIDVSGATSAAQAARSMPSSAPTRE